MVFAAKDAGAGCVIVTGTPPAQSAYSWRALGADHAIDVEEGDPLQRVREITGGELAEVVVHAADHSARAFEQARSSSPRPAVRSSSSAPCTGWHAVEPDTIWMKELTIVGIRGRYGVSIARALELIPSTGHAFAQLSTHTYALTDIQKAFDVAALETDVKPIDVTVVPTMP